MAEPGAGEELGAARATLHTERLRPSTRQVNVARRVAAVARIRVVGYGAAKRMELRIEHEPGRFVARIGDAEAFVVYERRGDVLDVQHTFTPPALRGRDVAAALTRAVLAYARAEGLRVIPTCSYTRRFLAAHPELS